MCWTKKIERFLWLVISHFQKVVLAIVLILLLDSCDSTTWKAKRLDLSPDTLEGFSALEKEEILRAIERMPKLPRPYPIPSASKSYPDIMRCAPFMRTWGDVDSYLNDLLEPKSFGYSYFYVPNGFAMVTQVEQIKANGHSIGDEYRWSLENAPALGKNFDFIDYLGAVFKNNSGYYRCIVFILTSDYYSTSGEILMREAASYMNSGYGNLPFPLKKLRLGRNHHLDVLVYEFHKPEYGQDANLILPSKHSTTFHLKSAFMPYGDEGNHRNYHGVFFSKEVGCLPLFRTEFLFEEIENLLNSYILEDARILQHEKEQFYLSLRHHYEGGYDEWIYDLFLDSSNYEGEARIRLFGGKRLDIRWNIKDKEPPYRVISTGGRLLKIDNIEEGKYYGYERFH